MGIGNWKFFVILRYMIITYHGVETVKIQFGDIILAFNPVSKESKLPSARFGADIVFSTLNHPDMNGAETVTYGDRKPFVVTGPGEYEIKGIFAEGFYAGDSEYGGEKLRNTIYLVRIENMNLCYLGALQSATLPKEVSEAIEDVDILFVPIGGEGVLKPADAYKLAVALEPKIIIPIHFGDVGDKNALKTFLKEGGAEGNGKAEEKLTLKKKDLEGKEGEIVVLKQA